MTYNSTKEIAVIYVNGEIKEGANGAGALSEDWDGLAVFGEHGAPDGKLDYFDEIEMYDRELSPLEVRQMFMKCSDVLQYGKYSSSWYILYIVSPLRTHCFSCTFIHCFIYYCHSHSFKRENSLKEFSDFRPFIKSLALYFPD